MRTTLLLLLSCLILLSGCARHYVITTNSGSQISTKSKPRLKDGNYAYKDLLGRDAVISASRVTGISPASMMEDDGPQDTLPAK